VSYLLDTHIWLWSAFESHRLPEGLLKELEQNLCYVSIASIWEAHPKSALGKLPLPIPLMELVERTEQAFAILPINPQHVLAVGSLPSHHRDPQRIRTYSAVRAPSRQ